MTEIAEQVRDLINKRSPLEALTLIKQNSPQEVKQVINNLFDDPKQMEKLDEGWQKLVSLVYNSYFSFITSDQTDDQSLTECTVSSLSAAKHSRELGFPELEVTFMFNAAQALTHMDMKERALKCYMEAKKLVESMEGNHTDWYAAILNNIGALFIETKRIEEAEDYLKQALEMRRKLAEEDENRLPELAETLSNAAALYGDKRNYKLSEDYYNEAISIFSKLAQDNFFHKANLASTLNNYSIVLKRIGRHEEAENKLKESLEMFKELTGINKVFEGMYAETYNLLGMLYNETGRQKEAEKCFNEWKSILEKMDKEQIQEKIGRSEGE
ncbi:MAG: tetratricopeptide repeat protein [Halobacteriota archaeon]